MDKPLVGIIMGSDSDFSVMEEASKILENFKVAHEVLVTSAHRTPERTRKYVQGAKRRGLRIFIAGAGGAAHLAGVVAAESTLPVIGVPINSTPLNGLDSLLSTAQMRNRCGYSKYRKVGSKKCRSSCCPNSCISR